MGDKLLAVFYIIGGLFLAGIVAIIVISLVLFVKDGVNKRYWIETGADTYYTDKYTEKDNCIYFTDRWGDNKLCGSYNVIDKGNR